MKILSLFDGVSIAQQALKNNGIKVDKYFASEIDRYTISITQKNFPETIQLGSIVGLKIGWQPDLLIGGSPCFVAGTFILTDKGYKEVQDIIVGDKVLTHTGNFKAVEKVGGKKSIIYEVFAQGVTDIKTTSDHPFYVRTMKRVWDNKNRIHKRTFSSPEWISVSMLEKGDFIGVRIPTEEKNILSISEEDALLLGRYTADGYLRKGKRAGRKNSYHHLITFCIGKKKLNDFIGLVKSYHLGKVEERTAYKCRIIDEKLHKFCLMVGCGASNKEIPSFILYGSKKIAKAFLDGYMAGDGCYTNGKYKASTVSHKLALGLCLLISKVYGTGANIHRHIPSPTTIIEGRVVNQRKSWQVKFQKEHRKQDNYYIENGIIWYPFKEIIITNEKEKVYNIQVVDDNSYTANNAIVHNCQDLSIAKNNRQGLAGVRSGLFWEYVRILKECKPKFFILENVNSMPAEAKKTITEALGVESVMLNAALLSAQNRKRLFWVGKLVGNHYEQVIILQPEDRNIFLKDIIEDGLPEREKSYCIDANYFKGGKIGGTHQSSTRNYTIRLGQIGKGGQGDRIYSINGKSVNLSAHGDGRGAKTGLYLIKGVASRTYPRIPNGEKREKRIEVRDDEKSNSMTSVQSDSMVAIIQTSRGYNKGGIKARDGKTPTLSSSFWQENNKLMDGYYVRKLTPLECERLQSLPDKFTEKGINEKGEEVTISNTQRYRACGNGFNCAVIEHILKYLK